MVRIGNQNYTISELIKVKRSLIKVLLSPKKVINLLKVKYSEKRRNPRVNGLPYSVFVETSSYCNLRCPMCLKVQKCSQFDNRNLTLEEFKAVMEQLGPTMITLRLWNYGEPLINKDVFEMIKIAKRYNVFTVLSTNGALMDREASKKLLKSGLDFLIISFDGGSKETYEKNRKGGTFERVLENIGEFMKLKKSLKKEDILVSMQFIIMNTNEKEIGKIREISKKFKIDKLMLRILNVVSQEGSKLLPKKEEYQKIEETDGIKNNFCSNLWEETVINSTGEITPCCMDASIEYSMGNFFKEKSFKRLWNGQRYLEFRRKIMTDLRSIPLCGNYCYKKDNKINFLE